MITIDNEEVSLATDEGSKLALPLKKFLPRIIAPKLNVIAPNGVKAIVQRNHIVMVVCEIKPGAYRLQWQAVKDGGYCYRTLALPYVLLVVPFSFHGEELTPRPEAIECYYRNEPLMDIKDNLFYPALLNCGPWYGNLLPSWICMSRLNLAPVLYLKTPNERLWKTIGRVQNYFFGSSFNWEWPKHWYSYCRWSEADPRITDVDRWQKETLKDPDFILKVNWMPAKKNLKETMDYTVTRLNMGFPVLSYNYLRHIVVNYFTTST